LLGPAEVLAILLLRLLPLQIFKKKDSLEGSMVIGHRSLQLCVKCAQVLHWPGRPECVYIIGKWCAGQGERGKH